jgi:hypothetical protein
MNLDYLLPGFLGLLLQVFAIKLPYAKKKATVANYPFSFKCWILDEWTVIVGNIVSVLLLLVLIDNLIALKPGLKNYIEFLFAFVGFTGSSIFMAAFSAFDKKVMKVIDEKTNIADGITPPGKN